MPVAVGLAITHRLINTLQIHCKLRLRKSEPEKMVFAKMADDLVLQYKSNVAL
jgi:hypothetical protein